MTNLRRHSIPNALSKVERKHLNNIVPPTAPLGWCVVVGGIMRP